MIYTQKTVSFWSWIYYVVLTLVGAFFLMNLTLAIIKFKFSESEKLKHEAKSLRSLQRKEKDSWDKSLSYSLMKMKKQKFFHGVKRRTTFKRRSNKQDSQILIKLFKIEGGNNYIENVLESNNENQSPLRSDKGSATRINGGLFSRYLREKGAVLPFPTSKPEEESSMNNSAAIKKPPAEYITPIDSKKESWFYHITHNNRISSSKSIMNDISHDRNSVENNSQKSNSSKLITRPPKDPLESKPSSFLLKEDTSSDRSTKKRSVMGPLWKVRMAALILSRRKNLVRPAGDDDDPRGFTPLRTPAEEDPNKPEDAEKPDVSIFKLISNGISSKIASPIISPRLKVSKPQKKIS
jgi:hypothetical protein